MVRLRSLSLIFLLLQGGAAWGADIQLPGVGIDLTGGPTELATAIKIMLGLTVLSLAPAILIMMTSFTRIIIVLSILRHALGMQQIPPNTVMISLALFLTAFNMSPVFDAIGESAWGPYEAGEITAEAALGRAVVPLRRFMAGQTDERDLLLIVELSRKPRPDKLEEVSTVSLIPAFLLSELRTAFEIGFVIFLPFLLIDIIVAAILMSMGMMMVPPMMISLPIKILMFVLVDGWRLVIDSLMGSFY